MCITNYYFVILILIIILTSVNSSVLKDNDKLYLIQVEYGYNITNFELSVLNVDDSEINDNLASRIAFMNGSSCDDEIFDLYSTYINKYWIFLVNSTSVADSLLERDDYKKNELYINGIIVPQSLNYTMPSKNNNKKIPIFIVKDNITEKLSTYDIRNMNKHIYFLFEIKRNISSYPEMYFLIVSIILLISSFALIIYWKVRMKSLAGINILPIHKFLFLIPFFAFFLSITLLVKAINIRGKDPNREYDDSIYVDTAMITISAIYKSILWFIILLLGYGWNIIRKNCGRDGCKKILKWCVVIYVLMCLDQIVDSTGVMAWVFHLSEIKNIAFYALMLFYLLRKINEAVKFLEKKLEYVRVFGPENAEAVIFKIKLVKKMKIMMYSYVALYLVVMLIHKVAVLSYDTTLLEIFDYNIVDLYLVLHLLYIFRPQQLPPNFNVDLGDNFDEDIGLIYKAFLPKYQLVNEIFKENEKNIKKIKDKNIPILVLGPCLNHDYSGGEEEISLNNYINNIEIGYAAT